MAINWQTACGVGDVPFGVGLLRVVVADRLIRMEGSLGARWLGTPQIARVR